MTALVAGLILVPLLDLSFKRFVVHRTRPIPLGPWGEVRAVPGQMWIVRASSRPLALAQMWILWALAAGALVSIAALLPSCAVFAGLLLGGSCSHAIETSARDGICDCIALKFWPAFDLSDVAITVGAIGMGARLAAAL